MRNTVFSVFSFLGGYDKIDLGGAAMIKYKRIFTIVIDSLGVGAMEDAAAYGDAGTDTLGHISQRVEEFHIPNLQSLGLANLHPLKQVEPVTHPEGYYIDRKSVV